jgi:hypothetical protein
MEGNASSVPTDRAALAAILRAVPADMQTTLVIKRTAKEAWDVVKMMRVGVNRVKRVTAQRLRKEFEAITFRDSETLDSFAMWITVIINHLRSLGDQVDEEKVVEKILREVPERYAQMACSIETLLDLSTISVKELLRRLRSSEGRGGGSSSSTNSAGVLLLTKEEWEQRREQHEQGQGSANGRSKNGNGGKKGKGKTKNNNGCNGKGERDMSTVKCYNCNHMGHFSKQCPEPQRERKGWANLAQEEKEEEALLMARIGKVILATPAERDTDLVLLNEKRPKATAMEDAGCCDTSWFLDSGASNHMHGRHEYFSELDTSVRGDTSPTYL